jgi:hypothetical protein
MGRRSGFAGYARLKIVGAAALLIMAQSAKAEPEVTHWSAYLRAQPSQSAAVIDEIRHGSRLDVGHCAGDWCQVRQGAQSGWIDKDALKLPAPVQGGGPTNPPDCAWAGQAAGRAPEATRFCHTKSPRP